jgi:hypothetical protein
MLWFRIQTGSEFNGALDPDKDWQSGSGSRRAKMARKYRKESINFIFWSAGCSTLRAEGFSCTLDVYYGGLGISKLQFLTKKKKKKKKNYQLYFLQFLVFKTLDPYPDPDSLEMLDPYPYPDSINPDPQSLLIWNNVRKLCIPCTSRYS